MEIGIALISAIGGILVALVSQRYRKQESKELAIKEEESKLVRTLQDLVEAQDNKIAHLESLVSAGTEQIRLLRTQVDELQAVIISQAILIQELLPIKK